MAVSSTKNARDLWLRFKVVDIQGTGVLNQYVLVEWVADPTLLSGGARQPFNAWPYDAASRALATEYVTSVPAYIYVPQDSWDLLGLYRVLYYQLGYGPTPVVDSSWTFYAPGQLVINHPPLANPGPPRVFQLDPSDMLIDPLVLDGSGSTDDDLSANFGANRDPGPLTFKWEVATGATVSALPWQTGNFNQAKPIALSAGTAIPPSALGAYTFRLRVDDTDIPLATSSRGTDTDEVQHTIQRFGGGVFIFSPTAFAPRTFQFSESLDVPITYKVDPGLLADPRFAGGWVAELTIREPLTGSVVVTRVTPVPPTDIEGHFSWDGVYDDFAQPVSGQQFDVRVRVLDYNAQPITIPGRQTVDTQANAIRINVTSITIDATATKAVDFTKLIAGTARVLLPLTIDKPMGAQAPTALALEVLDLAGIVIGNVPVAGVPAQIQWDGSLGGFKLPLPEHVQLRVVARLGAAVLARSNLHHVKVVQVDVGVTSLGQTVSGGAQVHAINQGGPTMPAVTARVRLLGLTPDDLLSQTSEARVEVRYIQGNRADVTLLPGPAVGTWQLLPAGVTDYLLAWTSYCGGDLQCFGRATIDGVLIEGMTLAGTHVIWGENPTRAMVRGQVGDQSYQVVLYQESRFTQFRGAAGGLNVYALGPFSVLRSGDNGFGMAQLTNPLPGIEQVWSWSANLAAGMALYQTKVAAAAALQNQHPAAPGFNMQLETWSRYRGGHYHVFNAVQNRWVRRADAAAPPAADDITGAWYADTLAAIFANVQAGIFPPGW